MSPLAFSLLGTWSISYAAVPITNFATDKARALLTYLAVEADRPHRREHLAELLWPDGPRQRALRSLSQALARARRALAPIERAVGAPLLLADSRQLQFNRAAPACVDVAQFLGWSAGCPHHPARPLACAACAEQLERAVGLYRGPLLHGFCLDGCPAWDAWLQERREGLHARLLATLAALASFYERARQGDQALATWLRLIQAEPWNEEAHRGLMRLLAQRGQRAAALAQYERCCQVLEEELGVAPEPTTEALYATILSGATPEHGAPTAPAGEAPRLSIAGRTLAVPPPAQVAPLELALIGSFRSVRGGAELAGFGCAKARALLAYLAVEADRAHRRDHLATLLWPEQTTAQARRNLSQTLVRLRRALEAPPDAPPLVLADTHQLQFNRAAPARVDVAELLALAEALRQHPHEPPQLCHLCLRRAELAARLWRGPFLDGLELADSQPWDEWRASRREQLHILLSGLLLRLSAAYAAAGALADACAALRRLLQLEPRHEEAQRRLARLLAATPGREAAGREAWAW